MLAFTRARNAWPEVGAVPAVAGIHDYRLRMSRLEPVSSGSRPAPQRRLMPYAHPASALA